MNRPEDIPERVRAEAETIAKEATRAAFIDPLMPYYISVSPFIARAILAAEKRVREECAQKADRVAVNPPSGWPYDENPDKEVGWTSAGREIAAAIRKGGEHA